MKASSIEQIREHLAKGGRVVRLVGDDVQAEIIESSERSFKYVYDGKHIMTIPHTSVVTSFYELLPLEEREPVSVDHGTQKGPDDHDDEFSMESRRRLESLPILFSEQQTNADGWSKWGTRHGTVAELLEIFPFEDESETSQVLKYLLQAYEQILELEEKLTQPCKHNLAKCEWEYNSEFDRWETSCDDLITRQGNGEHPRLVGFRYCPFCSLEIVWAGPVEKSVDHGTHPGDNTEDSPVGWTIVAIDADGSVLCQAPNGKRRRYWLMDHGTQKETEEYIKVERGVHIPPACEMRLNKRIRKCLLFGRRPDLSDLLDWWQASTGERIELGERCKACNGTGEGVHGDCSKCKCSGYTVRPTWMGEKQ